MSPGEVIKRLKAALTKALPGTEIQWEMASSDRQVEGYPKERRSDSSLAAVMILLYPSDGKINTLFIQRPLYDGVHSGQIAFPGGKAEESDSGLTETALRETCEEIGLRGEKVSVIGKLTPLFIPVSNIEVTPVVGYTDTRPDFSLFNEEVVSIIESELSAFFRDDIIKEKPMLAGNEMLNVRYFDLKGHVIWGATAMILHELTELFRREGIIC